MITRTSWFWPGLTTLMVALGASACGDEDAPPALDNVTRIEKAVGPAGATLELSDGTKVEIPAGALSTTITISVREVDTAKPLPNNLDQAGKPYAFEPHGTLFNEPVKLSLPYDVARDDMNDVRPVKLNDDDDTQWKTVVGSDKGGGKLSFLVNSFSIYQVARPSRDSGVITLPDGAVIPIDAGFDATEPGFDAAVDAAMDDAAADAALDANLDADIDANDAGFTGIFEDPNLEQAVRDALGIATADLTDADLHLLTTLYPSQILTSLVGLERCVNLQVLGVAGTFTSAAPLSNLTMLTELIVDAPVAIADLGAITSLRRLTIRFANATGNLSQISGLTNLEYLQLYRTQITGTLASLSGMTQLDRLIIGEAPMIGGTLSDLAALPMVRNVDLPSSGVTGDLSQIANATQLLSLNLRGTAIVGNLSSLSLLNLQSFDAPVAVTGQLSVLGAMTNLGGVNIRGNHNIVGTLSDINTGTVSYIDVSESNVGGNLSNVTNNQNVLSYFYAGESNVSGDISELYYLVHMVELDLHGLPGVTGDITTGLLNMQYLTQLNLSDTSVDGDISVFSDKDSLIYLFLDNTNVSGELGSLLPMGSRGEAHLERTLVDPDLTALVNALPDLPPRLYLTGTLVDCGAQADNISALQEAGATLDFDCIF